MVWFWYRNSTTTRVVRVNLWWWATSKIDSWSSYYTSNIDQNLDSVYYARSNNKSAIAVTKFKISN